MPSYLFPNPKSLTCQKEQLIEPHIESISPIIKNLLNAFSESDPQQIRAYLKEIRIYNIPNRNELIQKIDDYEYDEAVSISNGITADLGVQIE